MGKTNRGFSGANVIACYAEAAGGGAQRDFNAPRNAPAKYPLEHLDKLTWHSGAFGYESAFGPSDVTVNHAALAGRTQMVGLEWTGFGPGGGGSLQFAVQGDVRTTEVALITHNLGYVPRVMIGFGAAMLSAGHVVQANASGGGRQVSVYTTTTQVILRETAISTASDLDAVTLTYRVLVMRVRAATPGLALWSRNSSGMQMARGKIVASSRFLRRTGVGDSPLSLNLGRTLDWKNGGVRVASGGVLVDTASYNGSHAAPPFVQVGL